ncbi:MAG: HEAT repeat domain-containing protein [Acidobacteria bacterium]|nr:HEAT repeat domain-containing protein [Acidobacteriota bacterium]
MRNGFRRGLYILGLVTAVTLWGEEDTAHLAARMKDRAATAAQRNDACRQLQGSKAVPHLEEALEDGVVRSCAAIQLRRAGAVDSLLRALNHPLTEVRARVIYELGQMKDPRAVSGLIAAAKDNEPVVSSGAVHALLQFDDPRVLPALLEVASRQGLSSLLAVNSLSRFQDPAVMPVLYKLLESPDPLLRVAAIGALGELGDGETAKKLAPLLKEQAEWRPAPGQGIGMFPAINLARAAQVAINRIQAREQEAAHGAH